MEKSYTGSDDEGSFDQITDPDASFEMSSEDDSIRTISIKNIKLEKEENKGIKRSYKRKKKEGTDGKIDGTDQHKTPRRRSTRNRSPTQVG